MFKRRNKKNVEVANTVDLSKEEVYRQIVDNYLKLSGKEVVANLSNFCERSNGRLTYDEMEKVLGEHYPKAGWVDKNDKKKCILVFMEYSGFPFYLADENYFYFP